MISSSGLYCENLGKGNSNLWVRVQFGSLMTQRILWFWFLVGNPLHILDRSPILEVSGGGGDGGNPSNLAEC